MIFCIERDNLNTRFKDFGSFMIDLVRSNLEPINGQWMKDKPYVMLHLDVLNQLAGHQQISEYYRLIIQQFCRNLVFTNHQFLLIQEQNSYPGITNKILGNTWALVPDQIGNARTYNHPLK